MDLRVQVETMSRFKVALVHIDADAPEMPGWVRDDLQRQGVELVIHECRTSDELAQFAGNADVVWLFGAGDVVTAANIDLLQRCGAIIRSGSGTDTVPVEEATKRGIMVANTPEATNDAVSDHAIGLLFAFLRQIVRQDRAVRSGTWAPKSIWPNCLTGQTLGLVGFGNVGRLVARKLSGFQMKVLAYDPYVDPAQMAECGVQAETLEGALRQADFVSVHCPLTAETYHLIGERELRWLKPTAVLVNTSRGSVIDEPVLVRALRERWFAGAALDVLEAEPPPPDHPLFQMDNVVLTPHVAGFYDRFWDNMWRLSVETVTDLACGRWPRSYVNRNVKPRWALALRQ